MVEIHGSSKVAKNDLWHIEFRHMTLCGEEAIATARGLIDATCPECIAMYKKIMRLDEPYHCALCGEKISKLEADEHLLKVHKIEPSKH